MSQSAAPSPSGSPEASAGGAGGSLKGPGYPARDPEVTCPSCGRFAGTYERCPFCGARLEVRLSIRILRRISLVVGILGVGILFAAAPHLEVPLREVSSFTPTSNFAILRIRGKVVADPLYGERGGSFYMGVDDGTGRINLKAYGRASEGLRALGLGAGDLVEAQGSIRVEAGKAPSMFLAVARHVKIVEKGTVPVRTGPVRTPPVRVKVAEITPEQASGRALVQVEGTIRRAWTTDVGRGGDLEDGSGKVVVWLYENERDALGESFAHLAQGARLRVTGRLATYRTKGGEVVTQIRPLARPGSLEHLGNDPVPVRRIRPRPSPAAPRPPAPGDAAPAATVPGDGAQDPVQPVSPAPFGPSAPSVPEPPAPPAPEPAGAGTEGPGAPAATAVTTATEAGS